MGVFITLEEPTKPMREAAASAGFWQTKTVHGTKHPRLQILTIEDLLSGQAHRHAAVAGHPQLQTGAQGESVEEEG
jgi:hypothetical protein